MAQNSETQGGPYSGTVGELRREFGAETYLFEPLWLLRPNDSGFAVDIPQSGQSRQTRQVGTHGGVFSAGKRRLPASISNVAVS